ncbi:hypothetical protein HYU10_03460 [Candidatus Woesearchaeota archaeon]|nr:hypothetical protein [Candidatus Woesearchaeota archaeon]MBI2130802.1 hypothetical protein [Candidatus Woesearchaeota archaeon]MBI2661083.1 hypothetical protein [Candidatus Woesearchaeota archaeon]
MDWKECCNKRIVKNVKPDADMVSSLVKSSRNKMESGNKLPLSEITAASKLTLAYDSLRELLEALALKRGYKIYNHECYSAFLREIVSESGKGDEFDEIRKLRNNVNYYGKEISIDESNVSIAKIKALRLFVADLVEGSMPIDCE